MEKIVRDYFQSWLVKDGAVLDEIFDENIVYVECYGPEYHGIEQIRKWFRDWNEKGSVLGWDIKRIVMQGNTIAVEWYFRYVFEGKEGDFDGVSIIEFDDRWKIVKLSEYKSVSKHYFPYS